jgi:hypothetical protein
VSASSDRLSADDMAKPDDGDDFAVAVHRLLKFEAP